MSMLHKNIIYKLIILLSFALLIACEHSVITPTADLPDPNLSEIAMIRADPNWGTVVIYNPNTCREIGEACGFFRLHAYAHNHLNHTLLGEPDDYPASQENQADCWAAKYGKSNEIIAAVELLQDKNRHASLKIHGDPIKRAENIKACANQAGKWN
jgi:hypothetical protein